MNWRVLAVAGLVGVAVVGRADVLVLRSGEVLTGEVLSADAGAGTNVIQIRISNATHTISSVRSEAATNVVEVRRETAEQQLAAKTEEAYQEISRYRLSSASFPAAHYDRVIGAFRRFLAEHPDSPHGGAVSESIRQWSAERDRVAAGQAKWNNQWYRGDGAAAATAQIKAAELVGQGDHYQSLDRYDLAIARYQEALANQPLFVGSVDPIAGKIDAAFQQWRSKPAALTSPPERTGTVTESTVDLKRQADQLRARIADIQSQQQVVSGAQKVWGHLDANNRWVHVYDARIPGATIHWFSRDGKDLGAILPTPPSLGSLPNDLQRIEARIAQLEAEKARPKPDPATAVKNQEEAIRALSDQCAKTLSAARSAAVRPSDFLLAEGAQPAAVAQAKIATGASKVVATASSSPTNGPAPATPVPAVAAESWWKKYLIFIIVGVLGGAWVLWSLRR